MDLESFLPSLYTLVDDWQRVVHPPAARKPGRPPRPSDGEILTLAVLSQWPRFRSERDFWRFADAHLRGHFPNLLSQSQFNRRVRALEPELRALQRDLSRELADDSEVYRVLDTTLVPAIVRARARRKGLFAGQAAFGRSVSKTEWTYGFKVALVADPKGVVTSFGLAPANRDERKVGDALLAADGHDAYLADAGFSSAAWERRWLEVQGALVAATPQRTARRAWPERDRRWASGKRQLIEGVIGQLKDLFRLERHRAKTLGGLLAALGRQGRRLHLRPGTKCAPGKTAASTGLLVGLNNCTSTVLGTLHTPEHLPVGARCLYGRLGGSPSLRTVRAFFFRRIVEASPEQEVPRMWDLGSLPFAVVGMAGALWIALAALFVVRATFSAATVIWSTLLQRRVPEALRERVSSLDFFVCLGLMPVSMAVAGPAGAAFGVTAVFLVAGILPIFFAAATILLPRLDCDELARPLDHPPEEPAPTDLP